MEGKWDVEQLQVALAESIEFYNQEQNHEQIGNVTPAHAYYGRREEIPLRREEKIVQTLYERFQFSSGQKSN